MTDPTIRGQVGSELKRLRAGAQARTRSTARRTVDEAARAVGWSRAKLYRSEAGDGPVTADEARSLARHYRADRETADRVARMAGAVETRQGSWWDALGGAPSPWFEAYLAAEARAATIAMWAPGLVPGLLQTEEYATQVILAKDPNEVERRVAIRMRRQRVLAGTSPARLMVLMGESALRQAVGDEHLMRRQMRHLLMATDSGHVTIRVVPFLARAHSGLAGGPIVVLDGEGESGGLVYLESHATAAYAAERAAIDEHLRILDEIADASLSPERSRVLIAAIGWLTEYGGASK